MTLGSLFDGSGGFPLAGQLCGITPLWASEVEPYPIAVTRSRFPEMEHLGDVRKINGGLIPPVDVITFGSPCQGLSVAGKKKGLADERSGLFMEAVRIITEMREETHGEYPKFALWENVPGAFSSNRGADFRSVLQSLIQIVEPGAVMPAVPKGGWPRYDCYVGDGWSLAYRTFDAQYWGVPQRRRRIHLVLHLGGERAGAVLFEREGLRGYSAAGGAPGEGAAGDAAGGVGVSNICLDDQGGSCIHVQLDGKCPTLRAEAHGNVPCVIESAGFKAGQSKAGGLGWQEECAATLSAEASGTEPTVCVKCWDARGNGDGCTASTITGDHENRVTDYTNVVCMATGQANAEVMYNKSTTLLAGCEHPIVCTASYIIRRLTPGECCRLQGFPDGWGTPDAKGDFPEEEYRFWLEVRNTHGEINGRPARDYTKTQMLGWYGKLHTDSAEYKMWGNGIALPPALYVMEGLAGELTKKGGTYEPYGMD